jgi:hypothetical protein
MLRQISHIFYKMSRQVIKFIYKRDVEDVVSVLAPVPVDYRLRTLTQHYSRRGRMPATRLRTAAT